METFVINVFVSFVPPKSIIQLYTTYMTLLAEYYQQLSCSLRILYELVLYFIYLGVSGYDIVIKILFASIQYTSKII